MQRYFAAWGFVVLAACGRSVGVADYSRLCESDDDCTLVADGDLCGPCTCVSATIATSELEQYTSDASGVCPPDVTGIECLCALPPSPVCSDEECEVPAG